MKQLANPKKNRIRLVFDYESTSGSVMTALALALPFIALAYVFAHPEQALRVFLRVLAHIMAMSH
jgi:hypothetical protein